MLCGKATTSLLFSNLRSFPVNLKNKQWKIFFIGFFGKNLLNGKYGEAATSQTILLGVTGTHSSLRNSMCKFNKRQTPSPASEIKTFYIFEYI